MPWQTTIQLQGQTYLGCGVSLNCIWCHSVESKRRKKDPNPSLRDSKRSGRPHRLGEGVPWRSPTVIPTATQCILYTVQVSLEWGYEYSILTASVADM